MAQQVKDAALSLQWLKSLLWCSFEPWPRNLHVPWSWPKKANKQKNKPLLFLSESKDKIPGSLAKINSQDMKYENQS